MCGLDDPVQHRLHSHTHTDNSCCTLAMMCLFLYIHASSHCMFTLLYFITAFVNVTPLDVFKKTMGRVIGDEKGVLLLQKLRHLQFCLWQPKHDLFSPYPNLSPVTCHLSPVTCHLPVSWNRKDQNDQKLLNISVLMWSLVWTITTVWNILLLTFFVLSIQSLFTFVWFQLSNDIHILLFQSRPYFLSHTHIEHRHLANRGTGFYFWPLCSSIRTVWG